MTRLITKGMILAAGLGTRLRPLTDTIPKPLIDVGDRKIIEYNLALLGRSGIKDIAINLHHLGNQIESFLGDGRKYGVNLKYFHESKILGTGGGIKNAGGFFGEEHFVAINSDILTDLDLRDVMGFHFSSNASATLVLRPLGKGEAYTPVLVGGDRLVEFGTGDMMYTGVQVIDPSILKFLPENMFSDIVSDVFIPLLKQGIRISAYIHDGFWMEIGTKDKLDELNSIFAECEPDFWYLKPEVGHLVF